LVDRDSADGLRESTIQNLGRSCTVDQIIRRLKPRLSFLRFYSFSISSPQEYVNLDADKLVALQVSQLEKEKKELSERLRVIHRRMDHTERSYRKEELPLLKADYERQKATDLHTEKEARKTLLAVSKEKHQNDLILKERLKRIQPDYKELRKVLEGKRKEEFEGREKAALKKIEEEKEKRRNEFRQKKELERKKAEEAEKIRIEEEEMAKLREEGEFFEIWMGVYSFPFCSWMISDWLISLSTSLT